MRLKTLRPVAIIFLFFCGIGLYHLCKSVANITVTQFVIDNIFFQPYHSANRTDDDFCNGNLLMNDHHLSNLMWLWGYSDYGESMDGKQTFLIPSSVSNLSMIVSSRFTEIIPIQYILPANYSQ